MHTYHYTKTDIYSVAIKAATQDEADKIVNNIDLQDERVQLDRGYWEEDGVNDE
jgi:hypothetical protein